MQFRPLLSTEFVDNRRLGFGLEFEGRSLATVFEADDRESSPTETASVTADGSPAAALRSYRGSVESSASSSDGSSVSSVDHRSSRTALRSNSIGSIESAVSASSSVESIGSAEPAPSLPVSGSPSLSTNVVTGTAGERRREHCTTSEKELPSIHIGSVHLTSDRYTYLPSVAERRAKRIRRSVSIVERTGSGLERSSRYKYGSSPSRNLQERDSEPFGADFRTTCSSSHPSRIIARNIGSEDSNHGLMIQLPLSAQRIPLTMNSESKRIRNELVTNIMG